MGDREDTKLREVVVATYGYRHEAEFAAGFLDDAGIPYRLQIDDPALGISMSTSAKIWVAAMDERRARAILQQELAVEPEDGEEWEGEDGEVGEPDGSATATEARRARPDAPGRKAARTGSKVSPRPTPGQDVDRTPYGVGNVQPDLTLRQRLISLGGSVAVASTLGLQAVQDAGWMATGSIAVVGAGLAVVAMVGRAPGFLQRILAALSGDAP